MNVLDEHILESQRQLLQQWHIAARHIRYDVGHRGMKDPEIITMLLALRQPTFFTLDADFYKPRLCHARYCLVFLDVPEFQPAYFIRRFLRHPQLNTIAKRMGALVRVAPQGLTV